jgi:hypothetical protein
MPEFMGSDVGQGFGAIADDVPPVFVLTVLIRLYCRREPVSHDFAGEFRVLGIRPARVVKLHAFGEAWGNDRLLEVG